MIQNNVQFANKNRHFFPEPPTECSVAAACFYAWHNDSMFVCECFESHKEHWFVSDVALPSDSVL